MTTVSQQFDKVALRIFGHC